MNRSETSIPIPGWMTAYYCPADPAKPKRPTAGDAFARAMSKAKKEDARLLFISAKPVNEPDDTGWSAAIYFEFGDKSLGIYYAHLDPADDQWVKIDEGQIDALKDAIERIKRR